MALARLVKSGFPEIPARGLVGSGFGRKYKQTRQKKTIGGAVTGRKYTLFIPQCDVEEEAVASEGNVFIEIADVLEI